jgi:hypothetical protein
LPPLQQGSPFAPQAGPSLAPASPASLPLELPLLLPELLPDEPPLLLPEEPPLLLPELPPEELAPSGAGASVAAPSPDCASDEPPFGSKRSNWSPQAVADAIASQATRRLVIAAIQS